MLLEAREKAQTLTGVPPLFLHQSMPELDLYGTVEAAICCLDSLNYLTDAREVRETFRRLHLFIAPGGSLVFDVHALGKLEAMDGQVWLDEREDVYCVWRTEYSRRSRLLDYYVDIFSVRADGAMANSFEAPSALVQRFGADRMADRRRLRRNSRLRRFSRARTKQTGASIFPVSEKSDFMNDTLVRAMSKDGMVKATAVYTRALTKGAPAGSTTQPRRYPALGRRTAGVSP